MALVLLKTGIIHPGEEGSVPGQSIPSIDPIQMSTAQKLLLFWRKPAVSLEWYTCCATLLLKLAPCR